MARIKIDDLSNSRTISKDEMKMLRGGTTLISSVDLEASWPCKWKFSTDQPSSDSELLDQNVTIQLEKFMGA